MDKHVQPPLYISTICNIRHCKACLNTDQAANERVISYYDALYICGRLSHGCKVRSDEVQHYDVLATGRVCRYHGCYCHVLSVRVITWSHLTAEWCVCARVAPTANWSALPIVGCAAKRFLTDMTSNNEFTIGCSLLLHYNDGKMFYLLIIAAWSQ